MSEKLSPERAVRLLRAKAAELESAGLELTKDHPMSATVKSWSTSPSLASTSTRATSARSAAASARSSE